jgi:hypothetical protein
LLSPHTVLACVAHLKRVHARARVVKCLFGRVSTLLGAAGLFGAARDLFTTSYYLFSLLC